MPGIENQPMQLRTVSTSEWETPREYDTPEPTTHRTRPSSNSPGDDARERKRQHHRQSMARLRTVWRQRVEQLSALEETLHEELLSKLSRVDRSRAGHVGTNRVLEYAELVQAAEALRHEQYKLEDQLATWNKYVKLVGAEIRRLESEVQDINYGLDNYGTIVTRESCGVIVQDGLRSVQQIRMAFVKSNTNESSILDWRVRRVTTNPDTNLITSGVSCSRVFANVLIAELQQRTWTIVSTPELVSFLRGPQIDTSRVQTITNDTIAVTDSSTTADQPQHTLYSRLDSDDGQSKVVLIVPLAVNTLAVSDSRRARAGASALHFYHVDFGVQVEYVVSSVYDANADSVSRSVDACAFLMRWELLVFPPRTLSLGDKMKIDY